MDGTEQPGSVLDRIGALPVTVATLDAVLAQPDRPPVTVLFLWGRNCPNCDIAKNEIRLSPDRFLWPDVRWLHCNVYEDGEMATRFGLHGIPVFLVFRHARSVGRITSWPGTEAFVAAIGAQVNKVGGG